MEGSKGGARRLHIPGNKKENEEKTASGETKDMKDENKEMLKIGRQIKDKITHFDENTNK